MSHGQETNMFAHTQSQVNRWIGCFSVSLVPDSHAVSDFNLTSCHLAVAFQTICALASPAIHSQ